MRVPVNISKLRYFPGFLPEIYCIRTLLNHLLKKLFTETGQQIAIINIKYLHTSDLLLTRYNEW